MLFSDMVNIQLPISWTYVAMTEICYKNFLYFQIQSFDVEQIETKILIANVI